MKTGIAHLPLHGGKAPAWLFQRMKRLAREITLAIVSEYGPQEMLQKLSDPFWFQALGCVLGFDWHSSGVTTTTCGALKEGIKGLEKELGLFIAGGKGGTSRKTPSEIISAGDQLSCEPEKLVYASRMSAKVDSSAVQDGYQLYHHSFIFTKSGDWAVVQQGMNDANKYARRYHWLGSKVTNFVVEPHQAICCDSRGNALNMTAVESEEARQTTVMLSQVKPDTLVGEIKKMQNSMSRNFKPSGAGTIHPVQHDGVCHAERSETSHLYLPSHHHVDIHDIHPDRLYKIFTKTYESVPENFESLLGIEGVGPKTIRALALISELVYGKAPSFNDPVRYSFAHGGKDGHPYPVDKDTYDRSIEILRKAIKQSKVGNSEKMDAFKRLNYLMH
ncbi:MAG: DUF763 domain-containing protein [Planctomycetes bacterium]|nr:DUF763 domain-containing protein [Planctomycetota bacterium]